MTAGWREEGREGEHKKRGTVEKVGGRRGRGGGRGVGWGYGWLEGEGERKRKMRRK